MFSLTDLCELEAAVRRVEALAASPQLSEAARVMVSFTMSELTPTLELDPGPLADVFAGEDVDVEQVCSTLVSVLETTVGELHFGIAASDIVLTDVIVVAAALGDAAAHIPALSVRH
jgi:hypothetical protein